MLHRADAAAAGGSGEISRLEDQLAQAQAARISGEAAAAQALAGQATGEPAGRAEAGQSPGKQHACQCAHVLAASTGGAAAVAPAAQMCCCQLTAPPTHPLACVPATRCAEITALRQQLDAAVSRADAAEGRLDQLHEANERFVEERKVGSPVQCVSGTALLCTMWPSLRIAYLGGAHPSMAIMHTHTRPSRLSAAARCCSLPMP